MADAVPAWVEPMLASSSTLDKHHGGAGWVYERKLDGLRCIAVRDGAAVELWSRNHLPYTARFPGVAAGLLALPADRIVLDGEVVAVEGNRTSFSELQNPRGHAVVRLFAFDLVHLLGQDTRHLPLLERKRLLGLALEGAGPELSTVEAVGGDPAALLDAACRSGWEGLVGKRESAPYRAGRSPEWVKLKCSASQELVVGGWTEPAGARSGFGALLLGYYDDGGALHYAGRVGTGFSQATLTSLWRSLRSIERDTPPFVDPERARGIHWAEPRLVAEVSFSEWTPDGRLRHPSFKGLRTDKDAGDVRRETPP